MFGRGLPLVGFGEQQQQQCDDGSSWTGDGMTECSHNDQADSSSANDVALFGINLKAIGHQHRMTNLIEKR